MEQRLSLITIGVKNLKLIREFYEQKFGWRAEAGSDDIVFYRLNGLLIGFFPEAALAEDAGVSPARSGFKPFALAQNFSSIGRVDEEFETLKAKGVNIVKPPEKVFWGGYRGYVSDPEGNLWEIAWNPYMKMDGEGNVLGHASLDSLA